MGRVQKMRQTRAAPVTLRAAQSPGPLNCQVGQAGSVLPAAAGGKAAGLAEFSSDRWQSRSWKVSAVEGVGQVLLPAERAAQPHLSSDLQTLIPGESQEPFLYCFPLTIAPELMGMGRTMASPNVNILIL